MSLDFQVVFPQEIISITAVNLVPGVTPRTLDIMGADFRSVDEVRINEVPSPSVIVLSKTRLLAQIPPSLGNTAVQTLTVTSRQLTLTKKSLIQFQIGPSACKVRGILRLVQIYLKILFQEPGTDIISQRIGANALKNLGSTFDSNQGGGIVSDFFLANTTAMRQIVAIQGRDPSIPRDERLLSSKVITAQFSKQATALLVSVEINSQAGRSAVANLMV